MFLDIIIGQIAILFLITIIGVIASKYKVITEEVKNGIATIIFNITLPFLILTSVSGIELNKEILNNCMYVFSFSVVAQIILFFTGNTSAKILRLNESKSKIHVLSTMFGNVAFLGYPLFSALFPGGEGLLYAIIFHFTQDLFIWTIGIFIFNSGKGLKLSESLKHLINPNTISFVFGILLLVLGLKIPEFIFKPLSGLGNTTIYLAMLYIGAVLAQNPMISAFKKIEIYVFSFNKLIFIPFILILMIKFISLWFNLEIGNIAKTVIIMQAAMPSMTMIVVLAKKFGSDDIYATENLFLSTIFCIATLPVIYFLIQFI